MNPRFKPIPGKVRSVSEELLHNKDVKNFYMLCQLVQEGPKTSNKQLMSFFTYNPGKVTAARWITTANNILCLYMQATQPTKELVLLIGKYSQVLVQFFRFSSF